MLSARNTINPPTTAPLNHCRGGGRRWPRIRATPSMIVPARMKRDAFIHIGGIDSIATEMAK